MSLKISLIDDDPMTRTMLEDFIREKYPFAILTCWSTGEEALANMKDSQDLIVMDYHLDSVSSGSLNGIEIFKKLKSRFPSTPVIFLSGQEESKVAASTLLHGAHDYIVKNENLFQRLGQSLNSVIGKSNTEAKRVGKKQLRLIIILVLLGILLAAYLMKN